MLCEDSNDESSDSSVSFPAVGRICPRNSRYVYPMWFAESETEKAQSFAGYKGYLVFAKMGFICPSRRCLYNYISRRACMQVA